MAEKEGAEVKVGNTKAPAELAARLLLAATGPNENVGAADEDDEGAARLSGAKEKAPGAELSEEKLTTVPELVAMKRKLVALLLEAADFGEAMALNLLLPAKQGSRRIKL